MPLPQSESPESGTVVGLDGSRRATRPVPTMTRTAVVSAANRAARTVAPLWPLETFVAVNPFLGIANLPFADAENMVDRIWGARLVMPRTFYAEAIERGDMGRRHIEQAIEQLNGSIAADHSAESVYLLAYSDEPESLPTPTVADILGAAGGRDWSTFVVERISHWAAGYFDEGQAAWRSPWRSESPYAAWRGEAEIDQTPEILGIDEFRSIVRTLPRDADELLVTVARTFGLTDESCTIYMQRLLATVAGWAGHARFRGWQAELAGGDDARVKEILAVRAAWDLALAEAFDETHPEAVETLRQRLTTPLHPDVARCHIVNLILHTAWEIASRKFLLDGLSADRRTLTDTGSVVVPAPEESERPRPSAQAVFCIDVRSERFRRALEAADPEIETLGFAGFFGFAIEVAPVDGEAGGAQCPVLLTPDFLVRSTAAGASAEETEKLADRTRIVRRLTAGWKHFSAAAVASFAFVESLGLTFAWRLLADSLGIGRRVAKARLVPAVDEAELGGRQAGIPLGNRIDAARNVLAGMSLVDNFAPLVALIGHGSETENNPYASRLNCGACGGHSGESNALVAARVLNDPDVRSALAGQGIRIPDDTFFLAGLHDTTTDEVTILNADSIPDSHAGPLSAFRTHLEQAGRTTRRERAPSFGLPAGRRVDSAVRRRAIDWSEVRPEWGLAGCAAFIVAPRDRTRGLDLGGRSFLHTYDWHCDEDFAVLEQIMTAPLIVASWISLQYFASTVDNRVFGSGDKTLHNVVGGLGVLEGNGGDLRVGLPMQTLHDGQRLVHQPLRLNAFIEAPISAISDILARHESVRTLAENGWIHIFAIQDEGRGIRRYAGDYRWEPAARMPAGDDVDEFLGPLRRRA